MIIRFTFLLLIILFALSGCSYELTTRQVWREVYKTEHLEDSERNIAPVSLREDIDFFVETLEEVHPNPYHDISQEDFYKMKEKLKNRINKPLTRHEFFLEFAPLVASLKEGHTDILAPPDLKEKYKKSGGRFFPITVKIDSTKIIASIDCSDSEVPIPQGSEIITINNLSSDSITKAIKMRISGSNDQYIINKAESNFSSDLYSIFGFEGPYEVKTKNQIFKIEGITWDSLLVRKRRAEPKKTKKQLDYQTLENNTGLLTINSFGVDMEEYSSFLKKTFSQIQDDSIDNLIIDVRKNGGGDSDLADLLITYISDIEFKSIGRTEWKRSKQYFKHLKRYAEWWARWKPLSKIRPHNQYMSGYANTKPGKIFTIEYQEKTHMRRDLQFTGDVYVLSSARTFSSAVIFLTIIKDYQLATIVGQESGGDANHYGELYPFVLPNSKLWMHTSVKYFLRPSGDKSSGGVKPDIVVKKSPGGKIDSELLTAQELISNRFNR